jgi:hypothetical protein
LNVFFLQWNINSSIPDFKKHSNYIFNFFKKNVLFFHLEKLFEKYFLLKHLIVNVVLKLEGNFIFRIKLKLTQTKEKIKIIWLFFVKTNS